LNVLLNQYVAFFCCSSSYSIEKDLEQLSSLGHFLKGSSATLGLIKVKEHCEHIQHFGGNRDETGVMEIPDQEVCLDKIKAALGDMRAEYVKAQRYFKTLYPPEAS
jgi:osomolarity two-component system phosphorelay intermediate protein YPD1